VDGEVVALDAAGRPSFNLLQHFRSGASRICYFIFDLLVCNDRDLTRLPLIERHKLLNLLVRLKSRRIRISEQFEVTANDMLVAVRAQKLEGVVAKRRDSFYEARKHSGTRIK